MILFLLLISAHSQTIDFTVVVDKKPLPFKENYTVHHNPVIRVCLTGAQPPVTVHYILFHGKEWEAKIFTVDEEYNEYRMIQPSTMYFDIILPVLKKGAYELVLGVTVGGKKCSTKKKILVE